MISTDRSRLDVTLIHDFLRSSYWAQGIPRTVVERSIQHSLCFGVYLDGRQVGFAKNYYQILQPLPTSRCFCRAGPTWRGISKLLMRAILEHPELQGLRRFLLATRDAHGPLCAVWL